MNDKHVRSRMANTLKIMQDLIWLMNGATDQLMFWAFIIAGCFETCSYITQYALNCFSINPKDTKKFDTLYYSHCRRQSFVKSRIEIGTRHCYSYTRSQKIFLP